MTYNLLIKMICNDCHKTERDMTVVYWASGDKHYCSECWPRHRYYEDESGRQAWKRIGNRYDPID
jgi:hypothetical protein